MMLFGKCKNYKYPILFFYLLAIAALLLVNSCNYSHKPEPINFKANEELENKFITFHLTDSVFLNYTLDSLKKIYPQSHNTKVLYYYLLYLKEHYTNNYYENYTNAEALLNYLENNKLTTVYSKYYTDALFAKGEYFFAARKYEEALKEYYKAKLILDAQTDTCNYSKYYNKLWNFYYSKKDYRKALDYLNISIDREEKCKNNTAYFLYFHRIQSTLNTKALCYEKLGAYDSAIIFYQQGIKFIQNQESIHEINNQKRELALGIYYGNLGGAFAYNKQPDSAIYYLNKSIHINSKPGYDSIDLQTAYLKLVDVYLSKKQYAKAKDILDFSDRLINSDSHPTIGYIRSKQRLLYYNYYYQSGQLEKAIKAFESFFHVQDSVNQIAYDLNNFSIGKEVDKIKSEYLLKNFEKKNEIKTIYIIVFSIVMALLFVIIILILRYLKQIKITANQTTLHNLQLKSTLQQFEQSNKNFARVMKVMAHDLRSPLAGITGITDILLNDRTIDENEKREMLTLIQSSSNNSLSMITELLSSSSNLEQKELVKEEINIIELLKQCTELLKFKANEKNISLHFHHSIESLNINADKEKLWRVFSNLIMNAIKFSHSGKSVYIHVEKYLNEIVVNVQDEGIGIPEKYYSKVFDMFTEAKRKGTFGEQPFGIGLHICKQIVEAHNGKIWFISNEPIGTSFYVSLPIN